MVLRIFTQKDITLYGKDIYSLNEAISERAPDRRKQGFVLDDCSSSPAPNTCR